MYRVGEAQVCWRRAYMLGMLRASCQFAGLRIGEQQSTIAKTLYGAGV